MTCIRYLQSLRVQSTTMATPHLHVQTPLYESFPLSKKAGFPVYMKWENVQPTGSFKIRGIGHLCQKKVLAGGKRVVSSSGGNAGYAAAYAAKRLGLPATIVVPQLTPESMRQRMRDLGAEVIVHGKIWNEANVKALEILASTPDAIFLHPFDHPDIWMGHSTMVLEMKEQLPCRPDLIVTCVGGGGILCGMALGLDRVGWQDVPILAMETIGADCFNVSVKAGKATALPGITSVAKSLGSLIPAPQCMEILKDHKILSEAIPDVEAVKACFSVLHDHSILVEPACGAALAAVYSRVVHRLQEEKQLPSELKCVVVVLCGGRCTTLDDLLKLKKDFDL